MSLTYFGAISYNVFYVARKEGRLTRMRELEDSVKEKLVYFSVHSFNYICKSKHLYNILVK